MSLVNDGPAAEAEVCDALARRRRALSAGPARWRAQRARGGGAGPARRPASGVRADVWVATCGARSPGAGSRSGTGKSTSCTFPTTTWASPTCPANVLDDHARFLDDVVRFCEQTADYPEESQFRFTVETAWSIQHYVAHRPPEAVERLMRLAREGRIEVNALLGQPDQRAVLATRSRSGCSTRALSSSAAMASPSAPPS